MAYMLIKWKQDNKWDVYPLRKLVDVDISLKLANDPSLIDIFRDKPLMVNWSPTKAAAPATLLAIGTEVAMERKRNRLASTYAELHPTEAPYLHEDKENERLQKEIARVTEELRRTKEKLKRAEENLNCCNMAKDLRKGLKRLQLLERDRSPLGVRAATLVDIGNSVLVDSATLHRLKESNKAAGPFARALLNVVFNAEELEGRSLTGRKSNAFKDTPAKEALDPIRLNAVIAHTIVEYGDVEKQVKASLSSYLSRGH